VNSSLARAPWRLLLLASAATTLATVIPATLVYAASTAQPASALKTNKELSAVVERLNALQTWFSEADEKRARYQQEIKTADEAVARLGLTVARLKDQVQAIKQTQKQLAREASALEAKRVQERERIGQHLNAAYRMSGQDFFKLLLNQENPEQFDRMIRYHQYFSTARGKILAGYRATLTAIDDNRNKASAAREQLSSQSAAAAAEQSEFAALLDARKTRLAGLEKTTLSRKAERESLQRDRKRLQDLLAQLAKRADEIDGQEFAGRKGKLPRPVAGDKRASFGEPRADGRLSWQGDYITTTAGAPVRSVHRGKVVFADWLRGFGLLTIVEHGNGYMSLYGYADVLLKSPGDRVESGEQIANSGRSGGQPADGLYFEIRKDGEPVDPGQWLAAPK